MNDEAIIALYWQKDAEAVRESERKYGGCCLAAAERILRSREDAEECVNDTWLHAWNAMPPQRPRQLRLFLLRITRNLAINRLSVRSAEKRGGGEAALVLEELSECLAGSADVEGDCEARELGECIRRFVRALPPREGNVFVRRYFFTEPIAEIAQRYGLTENHVSVLLGRTRKKLRAHLIREGFWNE